MLTQLIVKQERNLIIFNSQWKTRSEAVPHKARPNWARKNRELIIDMGKNNGMVGFYIP